MTFAPADGDAGQLVAVSKGMWLYFMLSALLTAVTIVGAVRWEKICVSMIGRWRRFRAHP